MSIPLKPAIYDKAIIGLQSRPVYLPSQVDKSALARALGGFVGDAFNGKKVVFVTTKSFTRNGFSAPEFMWYLKCVFVKDSENSHWVLDVSIAERQDTPLQVKEYIEAAKAAIIDETVDKIAQLLSGLIQLSKDKRPRITHKVYTFVYTSSAAD